MTTILFPGQGSQEPGMGEGLWDMFPGQVEEADDVLGYSIRELCQGEDGRLDKTDFTQPALYVASCLAYLAWKEDSGVQASFAAGHSVGEYAALYAAGYVSFGDGLRMVKQRGALMGQQSGGGMAAVIGMDLDGVREVLDGNPSLSGVDLANINAPGQIVLSGKKDDIEAAQPVFEAAGARRYVPLNVSGAFHSRYMQEPGEGFLEVVSTVEFMEPEFPVISNLEAKPYEKGREAELLVQQIYSPVKWVDSILYLRAQGEMDFLELGPGKVLTGLLRRIK